MKTLKILYIEDDSENRSDLIEALSGQVINGQTIEIEGEATFEVGIRRIHDFHMVILDLYKGKAGDEGETAGIQLLDLIQKNMFIPVIFYSGTTAKVNDFRSQVIGIATKGDGGIAELKQEIKRLSDHNLPYIREKIHQHINNKLRDYFWVIIQKKKDIFKPEDQDYSLGYLLLRNIGNSLSKKNIINILEDLSINKNEEKVHPMEFYLYPTDNSNEYESGEIITNIHDKVFYVILTPSCDFIQRKNKGGKRKADNILLAKANPLSTTEPFQKYKKNKDKGPLSELIRSKNERYFFLPGTPFLQNMVVDFQNKIMVNYEDLRLNYERIAKLDSPFAEAMATRFIRYYNRVGFPDIDVDYILNHLD